MTTSDYILDIALRALVILQVRGRRLTARAMLLPVLLVGYAVVKYLHGIPTRGNDLELVIGAAVLGTTLGVLCAAFTRVTVTDRGPVSNAGFVAAALWVLGCGARFAFQLYSSHGGSGAIDRFSRAHSVTSGEAWVAALILMAMGEALARTAILGFRAFVMPRLNGSPAPVAFGS